MEPPAPDIVTEPTRSGARAAGLQLLSLLALVLFVVLLGRFLPVEDLIAATQARLQGLGAWAFVIFPLLFAVCNVLLLPGGILAIGSGFFFGLWTGWLLNITGSVLGAAISFFLARKLARGWVVRRFLQHDRWAWLDTAVAREGWKIIFLSQVHPLFPTSLLNYFYGVTRIRARTCLLWIALGQAPGLFLYAYLGTFAGHGLRTWREHEAFTALDWTLWIGGLLLASLILTALARLSRRLLVEAREKK